MRDPFVSTTSWVLVAAEAPCIFRLHNVFVVFFVIVSCLPPVVTVGEPCPHLGGALPGVVRRPRVVLQVDGLVKLVRWSGI